MRRERANEAFCTAVALGFADKGGRTGDPQKPQFLLQHMRPILTAMIMTQCQALGDVRPKRPKGGAYPLADGFQGFKPGPLLGRVAPHTLCRVMIHRDKDGHLPVLAGVGRRHIGPPHRIDVCGDDRPIMGFRAMRMALPRWGQQMMRTHQPQDPAWRRADTPMPQPGPHLTVPFARERRCLQDALAMVHQLVIRPRTHWPTPGTRRRGRVALPVDGRACDAPHAADTCQARGLASGGRGGLAHRLDLLRAKGRLVSSRPILSCHSSISIVASPSFWRNRASSRSWLSSGGCFSASWPASRNVSRQVVRRAAGIPNSRDTRSSGSPRHSRRTTSVFCRAENRPGFCHPLLLPSSVALRAPCEGTSRAISWVCIWIPPVSTILNAVSKLTGHQTSSQSAGSKGLARAVEHRDREPRQRGLQLRGRATAELGRPPLLGLGQRRDKTDQEAPAAQVYLEVLGNVRTATIKPMIAAKVKVGAQFFTDEYNIYHFTEAAYDHRTVNHGAGEYARRDPDGTGVHCNTMEGIWSGVRNFLDHFKGISQRFLHLRVARYEFLHNHGHLHWRLAFEAALRCIFSTTGDYWRRMTHQHRRIPLTLCYR